MLLRLAWSLSGRLRKRIMIKMGSRIKETMGLLRESNDLL